MRRSHAVVLVLALGACVPEKGGAAPTNAHRDARAIDFAARTLEGKTFRLSDHLGRRAVLIAFFASWSRPSLAEMPHLRALYACRQNEDLLIVGVAVDGPETVADVPAFARRNGLDFPIVLDEDSHIVSLYNPARAVPLSVLIDGQGRSVRIREGYNPGDEISLTRDVESVLGRSCNARSRSASRLTSRGSSAGVR